MAIIKRSVRDLGLCTVFELKDELRRQYPKDLVEVKEMPGGDVLVEMPDEIIDAVRLTVNRTVATAGSGGWPQRGHVRDSLPHASSSSGFGDGC